MNVPLTLIMLKTPAPRNGSTMTGRAGALPLFSTDNDPVVAPALTTTASLVAVIPRGLVALPLPLGVGTNYDFSRNEHHVVVIFDDGRHARFPSRSLLGLDQEQVQV